MRQGFGWLNRRTSLLSVLLKCLVFVTAVRCTAVMNEDGISDIRFTKSTSMEEGTGSETNTHLIRLPLSPASLTADSISSSEVKLRWPSAIAGEPIRSTSHYSVERSGRPVDKTSETTVVESGLKPQKNETFCIRHCAVAAHPKIVLESKAICIDGVRGSIPKIVKPMYIAFVEIVAASLVVSTVTCIFVHFGLERLRESLLRRGTDLPQRRLSEDFLKGFIREDEDHRESDERSHIAPMSIGATSV